jgi:ferredoxin
MPVVNFVNEKKLVQVPEGSNLRKVAQESGIQLYPHIHRVFNCHGLSQCGSCRVLISKGLENASSMGVMEKMRLKVSMAAVGHDDMRLACQTLVKGDMDVVTKPPLNLYGENFFS